MKIPSIFKKLLPFCLTICFLVSCHKKDSNPSPANYTSYSFADANYKQQTVVLLLIDSILNNVNALGNDGAQPLTASSLSALYDNTSHLFAAIDTGVSLSALVNSGGAFFSDAQVRAYFDTIQVRSSNPVFLQTPSSDSTNTISTGLYLPEYYEKCFMGALIYYQANQIFTQIPNADNTTINPAYGTTTMIHLWDELFGYMGMPTNYPTWTYPQLDNGVQNLADQPTQPDFIAHQTDFLFGEYIGRSTFEDTLFTTKGSTNYIQNIFNAFVTGRTAIASNDYTTRDAQLAIIQDIWERIIVTNTLGYAHKCLQLYSQGQQVSNLYGQHWTEMCGFVHMFQYNPTNKLGASNLNLIYGYVGSKPSASNITSLNNLTTLLKTTYGY